MNRISFTAIALTLAAAATAAGAQTAQRSAQVHYADLNLASNAGRQALDGRIRRAAESLCANPGARDLDSRMDSDACVAHAVAGASPQVRELVANYRTGTIAVAIR